MIDDFEFIYCSKIFDRNHEKSKRKKFYDGKGQCDWL
jgi:hypothetical protein